MESRVPPGAGKLERIQASLALERESKIADRAENRRRAVEALAPGADIPFVDYLRHKDGKGLGLDHRSVDILSEVYVAVVGIRPEDMFGIYPQAVSSEHQHVTEMAIAYRDNSEYRTRRERFWQGLDAAG